VPRVRDVQSIKSIRKFLRVLELLQNPLHSVLHPILRHWS
jgi:hypothetical protein